jgi:SAM-dependent methyltransferase
MTVSPDSSRSHAGQAVYSPATLAVYDVAVLGISNHLIWRCPTRRILALYDRCAAADHLDVGVGTGWFLDRCRFPSATPRITLLDLNAASLAAAARRIGRYAPERRRADVLEPLAMETGPFGSIGMSYLLHCLPGTLAEKAIAFDHLLPHLAPGGVVFGATLLGRGVERSAAAGALMRAYNRRGIFSNEADGAAELRSELGRRFARVSLEIVGCAALFEAREPRGLRREGAEHDADRGSAPRSAVSADDPLPT